MLYKRKIVDEIIKFLDLDEIIVLHGARQVGKTHILFWLKEYLEKKKHSVFFIDLEDSRYKRILDFGIDEFIKLIQEEGYKIKDDEKLFVFVDEIQYLKNPSEFLKLVADHHKEIKLVVSGSSSFEIKTKFKDSLVGRTVNFEIFNLSFEEFLLFKEYNFNPGFELTQKKEKELKFLFKEFVLFGSYPKIVLSDEIKVKEKRIQQIIDTYVRKDIRELANIKDIESFNKLLEVLASQSGQLLNVLEFSNTCNLAKQTVERYLFILEQTYIIKLVRPFHKNFKNEIFKTPKIFFYDSGLMQMLWLKKLQKEIIGTVFETAIFSELVKKYAKNNIYHWRTKDQKEIDFVLNYQNKLIPIEVKINFNRFDFGVMNYFIDKYKVDNFYVIGLEGIKKTKKYIYPWDLEH